MVESHAVSPQHVPTLHSSSVPLGHGCFFAQSCEASSHDVPQKFVVDACAHGDMIEISEKTKKDDLRILVSNAILFHSFIADSFTSLHDPDFFDLLLVVACAI